MKKLTRILLIILNLQLASGFAQDLHVIDSLQTVIKTAKQACPKPCKGDTIQIKTLLKLGDQYEYTIPDKALSYYQKALKIAEIINEKKLIAKCSNYIGLVYYYQSNYTKALEYYHKALKINEEIGNKKGIAANTGNIGVVYTDQSNSFKALEYYQRALKISEEIGNKKGIAAHLGNIGIVYASQDNYPKALEYYHKSLEINEDIGDKAGLVRNLGNIGIVYSAQNNFPKALEYYRKALKISKEIGDRNSEIINLTDIGDLYNNLKQYNKAIHHAKRGLEIAKDIGALNREKHVYSVLSEAYKGLNNYTKALEYKDLWIEVNDSIFNKEKAKSLAEMNVRYESEKKEQQIIQQETINAQQQVIIENEKWKSKTYFAFIVLGVFVFSTVILTFHYSKISTKNEVLLLKQEAKINKVEFENKQKDELIKSNEIQNEMKQIKRELLQALLYSKKRKERVNNIGKKIDKISGKSIIRKYDLLQLKKYIIEKSEELDKEENVQRQISTTHEMFFANIQKEYPDLTKTELKVLAYLRVDLSTKEIAESQAITVDAVRKTRYRIRKKLNLLSHESLEKFIFNYH